jgi:integrase
LQHNRVRVPVFALEALEQYRIHRLAAKLKVGECWQDLDYICCTSIRTCHTPSEVVVDQLRALLKKAGLPAIHFHDLHHSAGILLLTERFQEMLGHRNSYMTIDNVCS